MRGFFSSLFFMSRLSLFLFDLHFNTVEVTIKCSVSGHPSTNAMPLVTCIDEIILYNYSYEVCYSESLIVVSSWGSVMVHSLKEKHRMYKYKTKQWCNVFFIIVLTVHICLFSQDTAISYRRSSFNHIFVTFVFFFLPPSLLIRVTTIRGKWTPFGNQTLGKQEHPALEYWEPLCQKWFLWPSIDISNQMVSGDCRMKAKCQQPW